MEKVTLKVVFGVGLLQLNLGWKRLGKRMKKRVRTKAVFFNLLQVVELLKKPSFHSER